MKKRKFITSIIMLVLLCNLVACSTPEKSEVDNKRKVKSSNVETIDINGGDDNIYKISIEYQDDDVLQVDEITPQSEYNGFMCKSKSDTHLVFTDDTLNFTIYYDNKELKDCISEMRYNNMDLHTFVQINGVDTYLSTDSKAAILYADNFAILATYDSEKYFNEMSLIEIITFAQSIQL